MGKTVSKADLSEIVGRDERTLTRWQNDGMPVIEFGLGRGNENQYDTEAVIQWLMHQASLNGKKESSRDRLDRVRANREELALAKDLGEVVIAADLVEHFRSHDHLGQSRVAQHLSGCAGGGAVCPLRRRGGRPTD